MNKLKETSNPTNVVKTSFERFKKGVRRGALGLAISGILVGGIFNPVYGQTPIKGSNINQVSIPSKQSPVDTLREFNPFPTSVSLRVLPTDFKIVELSGKLNSKYGLKKIYPGMPGDELAGKLPPMQQFYRELMGKTKSVKITPTLNGCILMKLGFLVDTGVGKFDYRFPDSYVYPVSINEQNENSLSVTFARTVYYRGVDRKEHRAIASYIQIDAREGQPPRTRLYTPSTGIIIDSEYYNDPFTHPVVKKYGKFVNKGLKYLEQLEENEVKISKNKTQTPLGIVPAYLVYKHKTSVLVFSPSPKELYVITHDVETGKNNLVALKFPNARLVRLDKSDKGELKYYLVNDRVPDSELNGPVVRGNIITLSLNSDERATETNIAATVFELFTHENGGVLWEDKYAKSPTFSSFINKQCESR